MSQSVVDTCNSALQRVGAASILSLSDNSPEARACALAYDSNRRDELRKHSWNFAIKRVVLAPDTTAPAFDYKYAFTLPTDCLRVLRPPTSDLDWQIEGRKILTNDSNVLYLRYLADIDDTTQWDASFYNVMAASLAVDICEKLTQSNTKKQGLNAEYKEAVADARKVDAFESGPQDAADDDWWNARY
ncbi:Tail tubular protein Gp11 [uncultured Caudovirales phage]|uniref:Tail tubular protein Gp11 n=1 Tax=uncultured Caudovirales phage TaxID=2100421 RepID=A0A6J7W5T4_9CAUD|nr:Tail tubular protein Gp11 [uncultured Caudovirales phage]